MNPEPVLRYLSRLYGVPEPRFEVGVRDLPPGVVALYDASTQTIYFRDRDPSVRAICHEFGHHLHTVLGIECRGEECERFAEQLERHLSGRIIACPVCGESVAEDVYAMGGGLYGRCVLCGTYAKLAQPAWGRLAKAWLIPLAMSCVAAATAGLMPMPGLPREENLKRVRNIVSNWLVSALAWTVALLGG